jgi:creatinine amidohydrolase
MIQAEYVCRAVAREVNGVVGPGVAYGVCRTTRNFPGTISLSSRTLEALVREILAGYIEKGARRIAVISGHAGPPGTHGIAVGAGLLRSGAHMEALRQAALPLVERDERLTIMVIGPYDIAFPFLAEVASAAADGHAASIETSVLLAIDPHLGRTNRIPEAGRPQFPRFQVLSHPEGLFPSGVMGDASQASAALGEQTLQHVVGEIVKLLKGMLSGGDA